MGLCKHNGPLWAALTMRQIYLPKLPPNTASSFYHNWFWVFIHNHSSQIINWFKEQISQSVLRILPLNGRKKNAQVCVVQACKWCSAYTLALHLPTTAAQLEKPPRLSFGLCKLPTCYISSSQLQ